MFFRGLRKKKSEYENISGYLFISLAAIFFFVFLLLPIFKSLQISLYDYSGIGKMTKYIGFENYINSFTDEKVYIAFKNTFIFIKYFNSK